MEIAEFLLARIAEEETAALTVAAEAARLDAAFGVEDPGNWSRWSRPFASVSYQGPIADFVTSQTPARVVAECEAKRRVVEWRDYEGHGFPRGFVEHMHRQLALPYADHPDYQPEWSVESATA